MGSTVRADGPEAVAGLQGWPATLANLSAVGLVCFLLYWGLTAVLPQMQEGFRAEMREERQMFREELKALRSEMELHRRDEKIRVDRLADVLQTQQASILKNQEAILSALAELHKIRQGKGGSE